MTFSRPSISIAMSITGRESVFTPLWMTSCIKYNIYICLWLSEFRSKFDALHSCQKILYFLSPPLNCTPFLLATLPFSVLSMQIMPTFTYFLTNLELKFMLPFTSLLKLAQSFPRELHLLTAGMNIFLSFECLHVKKKNCRALSNLRLIHCINV